MLFKFANILFLIGIYSISFSAPRFQPPFSISYILIREVNIGEYDNSRPLSEMILLFNNGRAVFIRDTMVDTKYNSFHQKKVNAIMGLKTFEEIDKSKIIKPVSDYQITSDSLKIYYLPDGDKSTYFEGKFNRKVKIYEPVLAVIFNGKKRHTVDFDSDKATVYKFNVYKP